MKKKIRIKNVSTCNIIVTIIVAILFAGIAAMGRTEFNILKTTTDQYIDCERAAKQLQDGSDYLTEQVRLYATTAQREYMDLYFEEADVTMRREEAIEILQKYFDGTEIMDALQKALDYSQELMNTEYYSMRLVAETTGTEESSWPEEIQAVSLSQEDEALTDAQKLQKAQEIVCDN